MPLALAGFLSTGHLTIFDRDPSEPGFRCERRFTTLVLLHRRLPPFQGQRRLYANVARGSTFQDRFTGCKGRRQRGETTLTGGSNNRCRLQANRRSGGLVFVAPGHS